MHLVQLFLPLRDNAGDAFPRAMFDQVREELTDRAFRWRHRVRALARRGRLGGRRRRCPPRRRDPAGGHDGWTRYRQDLQQRFDQDEVLIRATVVEKL
jgi:hypothetical protein